MSLDFLPKVSSLSGDIFLRALQSLEKIINIWFSASASTVQQPHGTIVDRKIPSANTIFEIYGEIIFEAASAEKSTHENGRSIAISLICRILSKWQYRESIAEQYLSSSCASLKAALLGDLHASASVLVNIEAVLTSGHSGLLCLVTPIFMAARKIIPKGKIQKSPLHNVSNDIMRLCCYRLLTMIFCYFSESGCPLSFKLVDWKGLKPLDHSHSVAIFQCYAKSLKIHAILLKAHLLDTLIGSLYLEDNAGNIRFILNSISALLYADYKDFPELFPVLTKIFEDLLCKPSTVWSSSPTSLVDTQITIVRILEQWSRIGKLPTEQAQKFCSSLINLMVSLHSKGNIPLYFRLIISIYEALFSWLSISGSTPFTCVSSFVSALVKFINDPLASKRTKPAATTTSNTSNTSTAGPSIYGLKNRKSLTERVFTLELGTEDKRPKSLSPTLLKGIDEIFTEYTDSTLQRLLNLLLQEQINTNYPVKLDSCTVQDEDDILTMGNVKYYSLTSSILIGFNENFIFVRNSIGKFIWRHDFAKTGDQNYEEPQQMESSSIILDEDPIDPSQVLPFRTPLVLSEESLDPEIILNDSNWTRSLDNNKTIAAKITPILKEVSNHLRDEIIPEMPQKSRLNRIRPQPSLSIENDPEIISRLFFTHLGFLNSSTCALLCPLSPRDRSSFISDLKKLDVLPCRDMINIPIYFLASSEKAAVSKSFEQFVKGLGGFTQNSSGPIFADSSVEVNFPVISFSEAQSPSTQSNFNESVSILWSEDFEPIEFPSSTSNSSFVHLLISPVLINGSKGHFFRIRILLAPTLQPEYNSLLFSVRISVFNHLIIMFVVLWSHFGWNDFETICFESNDP